MSRNSHKISDTTKTEFFKLILFQSHQKIWQNYCHANLSTVFEPLTCWLHTSVLTGGFLGISVTALFAVYNFRKKSPLRFIFSSKYSKFYPDLRNAEKNWENAFPFLDNCFSIGCFKHSFLLRENTCHWLSIC